MAGASVSASASVLCGQASGHRRSRSSEEACAVTEGGRLTTPNRSAASLTWPKKELRSDESVKTPTSEEVSGSGR
jgi:hypothetical protein